MTEQTLTQAELEGERELQRLIESGELASTSPKLGDSADGDTNTPPKPDEDTPKPADAPADDPAKPTDVPAKPTEAPAETQAAVEIAQPDTAAIDAQLAAEHQSLLKLTEQRMALEGEQKGLAAKYSEINPALDELADKLDNGDLTQGAYDKQKRALEQQRAELERQYNANTEKLNGLSETEQQANGKIQGLEAQKDPLNIAVNTFLAQPVNAIYQDDNAARALGNLFQTLKSMPKMSGKTDTELLALADKQYRTLNDIEQAPVATTQPPKAPPGETAEQKAARLAKTIPTGISGMPPVVTNTGGNEYTDLAAKSGPEVEAALAKMTPDQLEAFLSNMK